MEKTALRILIDEINEAININKSHQQNEWSGQRLIVYENILTRATELLEQEKKQIIEAVNKGIENTVFQKDGDGYFYCPFDGEQYFTQTFNQ